METLSAESPDDLAAPSAPGVWRQHALWIMAAYGFVAGLPLPLSGFTLRQWMCEGGCLARAPSA